MEGAHGPVRSPAIRSISAAAGCTRAIATPGRESQERLDSPSIGLTWPRGTVHSEATVASMRAICTDLRTAFQAIGGASRHPLRGIEQTKWSPAWSERFARLANNLKTSLTELKDSADAFGSSIGFEAGSFDHADVQHLVNFGALLMRPEASDGILLLGPETAERSQTLRARAEFARRVASRVQRTRADYDLKATRLDLSALQQEWTNACVSSFILRGGRQKKVRSVLKPYCKEDVPQDIGRDLVVLQDLADLIAKTESLRPLFVGMERLFEGVGTEVAQVESIAAWAGQMRMAIRDFGVRCGNAEQIRDHAISLVSDYADLFGPSGDARRALTVLEANLSSMQLVADDLSAGMNLEAQTRLLEMQPGWMEEMAQRIDRWIANLSKAPQWAKWRLAASSGRGAGLEPLVEAIESGSITGDLITPVFEFAYARWNADEIVNSDEVLSTFLAEQHEATIEAFVAADARVAELSQQIVRARIGGGVPSTTNFGKDPEWGTLSYEVNRKARHLPLRQLFAKIPTVLTKLAPCMMMSPLSIAQYLPPDATPFDIVIFDEASQIAVWDAIGAIARGRQVVIVGDPQQLPPTSVGQRTDMDEDDGATVQSQQSILDECLASNLPSLRLDWHYRSRHESLIAFSNAKYYRGELVTFPSPFTSDTAVRLVPVLGGVYDRGKSKVNRKEAEAVVEEVVRRLKSSAGSIGIVTFNAEQQRVIENLLDQKRGNDPSLEAYWDKAKTSEPVLVKNIESIQGDERDVIIFSVAVGPDQTGRITAQISSLNGEGGHRRLNVAVTRARRELIVFSTLQPEQIDLGRTNARGVVDFKHFLEFAKNGARAIAEAFATTGRGTESPFEEAVKDALEQKGWVVHPQIGVSFFRVDLGIVHPDAPGRYLAGIEADGATYHRSASARDRDRLREATLVDLGWRIRRIWSTEWWMDKSSALEKIHQRLVADLEEDRALAAKKAEDVEAIVEAVAVGEEAPPADDAVAVQDEEGSDLVDTVYPPQAASLEYENEIEPSRLYARNAETAVGELAPTYKAADIRDVGAPDRERFYDPTYRAELRKMVDYVIETEAPIHFDLLVERISRAHGFQRSKDGIRGVVKAALGHRKFPITEDDGCELIWPKDADPKILPVWRGLGSRQHGNVPLPELASLAANLRALGLEGEDLVRAMQTALGSGGLLARRGSDLRLLRIMDVRLVDVWVALRSARSEGAQIEVVP